MIIALIGYIFDSYYPLFFLFFKKKLAYWRQELLEDLQSHHDKFQKILPFKVPISTSNGARVNIILQPKYFHRNAIRP